jgi:16S rRNA (cytidine1402-2'-O)-methyltransferase
VSKGLLYVVATPIGNLDDLTPRAAHILGQVDLIAAEDTRHTKLLLRHYAIDTPVKSLHQYNEQARLAPFLEALREGQSIALVSDAGTPLISDPGFLLVRAYAAEGGGIVPIPGVSAVICALSVSALPTDRFVFAGFPPRSSTQRKSWLKKWAQETATLVFYESNHRVSDTLADMAEVFGGTRKGVIAREMTKRHETFLRGDLKTLIHLVDQDSDQRKGEFVVLLAGASEMAQQHAEVDRVLRTLLSELPLKQAVSLASKITGYKKNNLYKQALKITNAQSHTNE